MLTYEEDKDWNNWDGGHWGRSVENTRRKPNYIKNCCIISIGCPFIIFLILLLFDIFTTGKFACTIPGFKKTPLCSKNSDLLSNRESNYTNTTNYSSYNNLNYTNYSNFYNLLNTTNYSVNPGNQSQFFENEINDQNINNIIGINRTDYSAFSLSNASNLSYSMLYESSISNNIEKPDDRLDTGEAIGISIGAVCGFIMLTICTVYSIKNGPKNIKYYCTNKTASNHQNIQLTEEELKFYEVRNPLQEAFEKNQGGYFQKGVCAIKKAIQKDREREFKDAIKLYNEGIDHILHCLKHNNNASDRFLIAKKIDIYVKRVNYINNCIENQKLIQDIKNDK